MHVMEDLTQFVGTDKNTYYFIKPIKNNIMVWKSIRDRNNEFNCGKLDLSVVNEDILTEAGIWEDLPAKIKETIIGVRQETKAERKERMAHARKQRKRKYDFSAFPEFLKCKYGREVKANYYQLQKKADEKKIPLADLVNGYQCQKCNPSRRGRKKKK